METAPNRRLELYRLSAQAARRLLGDDLDSHSDDLWEDPTGRDYLMALAGIAYYEWALGDRTSAIVTCSELLLRDPDDHLHITPVLEVCLLEDRTRESAEQVLDLSQPDSEEELLEEEESDVDGDSAMLDSARNYNYALGLLQLQGFEPDETYDIDAALETAIESNPYVPWLLLGEWEMPRKLPMQWVVGEYTEAIDYTSYAKNAWDMTPGALEALRQVASCQPQPEEPDFIFARQNPDRLGTIAPYVD